MKKILRVGRMKNFTNLLSIRKLWPLALHILVGAGVRPWSPLCIHGGHSWLATHHRSWSLHTWCLAHSWSGDLAHSWSGDLAHSWSGDLAHSWSRALAHSWSRALGHAWYGALGHTRSLAHSHVDAHWWWPTCWPLLGVTMTIIIVLLHRHLQKGRKREKDRTSLHVPACTPCKSQQVTMR